MGLDVAQLRVKVKADLTELDSAAVESRRKLRHLADAVTPVDNSLRKLGSTAEQTAWKLRSRDYERFGEWARGTGTRLTQGVTLPLLATLPEHLGSKIIYANGCRIGEQRLRELGITFKQIPYEIREQ